MFDFRYHVASLAAVFLALVIGILVGVGISGRGLVDRSERKILQNNIATLQADLAASKLHETQLGQQQQATKTFVEDAYPALVFDRLSGKRIALVVVGTDPHTAGQGVRQALADAGAGEVYRYRAVKVPVDATGLRSALLGNKQLAAYGRKGKLGDLGRELAHELVHGGKAPLWDALSSELVEERHGSETKPVDGVVVIRAVPPQAADTARFLTGLYDGLASAGIPAVGVEPHDSSPTAVTAFAHANLSSVDDVDQPLGRLALVLLLAGGDPGEYGVGLKTAPDGLLPPVAPVTPASPNA